ncbi:MFS transporter [Paenibacillus guangzhouensis]|uniref:MFS transporter n=1 Tax=Paenibacillus guangzhouensis TaxID=1473112 RepID=UPI002AB0BA8E|nr:MFS transporter [Paenibacillus guangzhouensis]
MRTYDHGYRLVNRTYCTELGVLLAGRVMQAAGAAVIPALSGMIPIRYFPSEERGKAIGIAVSSLAVGGVLGPVVSALIVSVVHWRWLFCLPLLVILVLPLFRKYLDDSPGHGGKVDWIGGNLLAGFVIFLILSMSFGAVELTSVSLLCFLLLIWRVRVTGDPFVQPKLFRHRKYTMGLLLAFVITGIGYSVPFLTPQMLGEVYRLPPGWIGLSMVPAALASALLGRKGGKIVDSKGSQVLFYSATVLMLLCFFLISTFAGVSPLWISVFLILGNVGQSFMLIAISHSISQTLPQEHAGIGTGLQSLMNFMSGAIAASFYGTMVDHGAERGWNPWNGHEGVQVFSNIYLAASLAIVIVGILYFVFFRKRIGPEGKMPQIKTHG